MSGGGHGGRGLWHAWAGCRGAGGGGVADGRKDGYSEARPVRELRKVGDQRLYSRGVRERRRLVNEMGSNAINTAVAL